MLELKILMLEDVPGDAEIVEYEIRKANIKFTSRRVDTKEDFVKGLEDFTPDLILSDYKLPSFDGISALKIAKEKCPDVPFIFVTGAMGEDLAVERLKEGAADYVLKDRLTRLVPAIERAMKEVENKAGVKKTENALRASAQKWHNTFDAINDSVCLLDMNRKILQCNKAMANLFGMSFSNIIGRTCTCCELVHGTSEPIKDCPMMRMKNSHKRETLDLSIGERHFVVTTDPLIDEAGNLTGGVHIFTDITERKQSEELLQKTLDEIYSLYNNAPCGYHSLDRDGVFVHINDTELSWMGYSRDEIIGKKNFQDFLTSDSQKIFRESYLKFKEEGWIKDLKFEIVHRDGSIMNTLLSANAIKDHDGNFVMSNSTLYNTTEIVKAEKEIQNRINELEEFYKMAVNREVKMKQLKKEVEKLNLELSRYNK